MISEDLPFQASPTVLCMQASEREECMQKVVCFIFVFLIRPQRLDSLSLNSSWVISQFFPFNLFLSLLIASTSWFITCMDEYLRY